MDTSNTETGRRRRVALTGAFVLLLVGVIGNVAVSWGITGSPASPRILVALSQVFTACTWTGAVWLGALLAYRAVMDSRS